VASGLLSQPGAAGAPLHLEVQHFTEELRDPMTHHRNNIFRGLEIWGTGQEFPKQQTQTWELTEDTETNTKE
jgi:hypothetical protein